MRLRKLSKPFSDNGTVCYAASVAYMKSRDTLFVFNNKVVFFIEDKFIGKGSGTDVRPKIN
jgi:hypothetical protein